MARRTASDGHPLSGGPPWARTSARLLVAVLAAGSVLAAGLAVPTAGLATAASALPALSGPGRLPDTTATPRATVVTDSTGDPIAWLYDQYRIPTAPGDVAETMKAAVVAIEDRRFLDHSGVDWIGVGRAVVTNLATSGSVIDGQGASTITMQYVKNHRLHALARNPRERAAAVADTLDRKLLDVTMAVAVEQRLTKAQILNRYLDTVYFGHGAYGVAAAARTYFDTTAADLTLPQAALLAAMVKAPSTFDPVTAPMTAQARRDLVLTVMAEVGSITPDQAAAARATALGVVEPLRRLEEGCVSADPGTGFFCRYVVDHLAERGLDVDELRRGGYTVRTTLDPRAQDAATRAAREQVPVAGRPGIANAVAVVEPGRDGRRVLALAANHELGPDAAAGQSAYALPTAPVPHGAGSTYKIFTAAAALEAGLGLRSDVPAPERYTSEEFTDGGGPYTVTGDGGARRDEITLTRALALSPNTTFVALLDELGSVDPVVDMARRLGMRKSLALPAGAGRTVGEAVRTEERASFTLGPVPAIPLELANVAATVVSGGVWCAPDPIVSVTDHAGETVALPPLPCEQAVPEGLADTLAVGLSESHTVGTAAGAADAAGWDRPMLGKTGTTQQNRSAAFVGATPRLAGAVMTWSDGDPPRPLCAGEPPRLCDGGTLSGGTAPAETWFATMVPLHDGRPVTPLPDPDPDLLSGDIPSGDIPFGDIPFGDISVADVDA